MPYIAGLGAAATLAGDRLRSGAHATEHHGGHGGVERRVRERELLGDCIDDRDRDGRLAGGALGVLAQVRLRLDGDQLGDGGRVVAEVEAVARADLEDPPAQRREQLGAPLGQAEPRTFGRTPDNVDDERFIAAWTEAALAVARRYAIDEHD